MICVRSQFVFVKFMILCEGFKNNYNNNNNNPGRGGTGGGRERSNPAKTTTALRDGS